jgi:HPt (histidine-containing phosphotransfer) domain-containing protein
MNLHEDAPALLDLEQIEDLRQIDGGLGKALATVVNTLLTRVPVQMASLRECIELRNFPDIVRAAHGLRGATGTVGASAIAHTCRKIEMAGKAHDESLLDELLLLLETQFEATRAAMLQQLA